MKILIVGSGGRESAIAHKVKSDNPNAQLYFAKGTASTHEMGKNFNTEDVEELLEIALQEKIDLTIVGPEAPLVAGIVDRFESKGLKCFGPTARAASLEGSKTFSKRFMQANGIKTASAEVFDSFAEASRYVKNQKFPLVIKASGLAGGKGVVICSDLEEAEATLEDFMIRRIYGDAGIQVVIEDYLDGFEASIIAVSNGENIFPFCTAKDYKKVGNGDTGANTGGMGAVAPSPEFSEAHWEDFRENILNPTMKGLKNENLLFKGFIFFGLMVTDQGCHLLEYNMRLGDPETQVLLPLLENNLLEVIEDCLEGKSVNLLFKNKKAVSLVMCSGGYPRSIETGYEITGLDKVQHSMVLFAGAKHLGDSIVTSGGRVLNLVATGDTYEEARKKVYADADPVNFDYAFYREDIAKF